MEFAYSFAGLVVGFIIGLTGIGGGALMTPALIVLFGIPPVIAVSTDLFYAAITKCGGIWAYAKNQFVEWKIVAFLLLGSVPSGLVTIGFLDKLESPAQLEYLINITLGISLTLTSIAVFFRDKIQRFMTANTQRPFHRHIEKWHSVLTIACGVLLGVLVTLSSVGAGALGTAMLIILYPRLSMPAIIGTDLVHAVVLTSVAGAGHYQMGNMDFELLFYLLIGSLPGVLVGSHVAVKLSLKIMQPLIGSLLLMIGLRFILAS